MGIVVFPLWVLSCFIENHNPWVVFSHLGLKYCRKMMIFQIPFIGYNEVWKMYLVRKYLLDKVTVLMDSDIKYKDVDWSQFRPWNIDQQTLQNAWDT